MPRFTKKQIEENIKTHSPTAVHDADAVKTLDYFLRSEGKIKTDFKDNDKWPNIDGGFELVLDPTISRRPGQKFIAQIKGTKSYAPDAEGNFHYQLQNLAFPAYVLKEVTLDPCILFVVLSERGKERVFWKYMSIDFLNSIDFNNKSKTIIFSNRDELFDEDSSINEFVKSLITIAENHPFTKKLSITEHTEEGIIRMLKECNKQICEDLERFDKSNESRDDISKRLLSKLEDMCMGSLLLNAIQLGHERPSEELAWGLSWMNIKTKFLGSFLQALKYLNRRIPEENQSERLMLKYYNFLWQIREYLMQNHNLKMLINLEKFPLNLNIEDKKYYTLIAATVDGIKTKDKLKKGGRYYIHKKKTFYVGTKRYFEITLQLANIYSTKFNRFVVYSNIDISTNYSIEIEYSEAEIKFWDEMVSKIKIVNNWNVSIDPIVLNKLASILKTKLKITSKYDEYHSLMSALTRTGIDFLHLIDLPQEAFDQFIGEVYSKVKTSYYKDILVNLRKNFSAFSIEVAGRNVIRYVLINLWESMLNNIKPKGPDYKKISNNNIEITAKCYPFDKSPYMYNLPTSKSNGKTVSRDIVRIIGLKRIEEALPYIILKNKVESTGEIYIPKEEMDREKILKYNSDLTKWDQNEGNSIIEYEDKVYIDSYEKNLIYILHRLINFSKNGNVGQEQLNKKYIKENLDKLKDTTKKETISKVFVDSKLLMIYGPAGTGKTTLMDYISSLMQGSRKLFLAKTHAAVENLKNKISSPGQASEFMGIDQFARKEAVAVASYDVIFIDECSTIDNRKMVEVLKNIRSDSLLVLAGDIHQIESIDFGNWFHYAKEILDEKTRVELNNNWRTDEESLLNLWDEVRNKKPLVIEKLVIDGPFSEDISSKIFDITDQDEIVLCLNYDGRFGLNNINNYFQEKNEGEAFVWQEWVYKIGDRILFNDSKRFPALYNNLKGRIVNIHLEEGSITFDVDVFTILTEINLKNSGLKILDSKDDSTQIRFTVFEKNNSSIEEEWELSRMKSVIPFQLAYAVSIHKSQGLEFDSVKIVIPSTNEENVTHGIFYTAITRAKRKLKIFWSGEIMDKIISKFNEESHTQNSLPIIKKDVQKFLETSVEK